MTRALDAFDQFERTGDPRPLAIAVRVNPLETVPFLRTAFLHVLLQEEELALGPRATSEVREELLRRALLSSVFETELARKARGSVADLLLRIRHPAAPRTNQEGLDEYLRWLEAIADREAEFRQPAYRVRELHRFSPGEGYPYDVLSVPERDLRALRVGARIRFRIDPHFLEFDAVVFEPDSRARTIGERFRESHSRAARLAIRDRTDLRYPSIEVLGPGPPGPLDGPSAGLAAFIAISFAVHHRKPLPPVAAFLGTLDDLGRLRRVGHLEEKVEGALEEGLVLLFVVGEIPPAVAQAVLGSGGTLVPLSEGTPATEAVNGIEQEIADRFPGWLEFDHRRLHAMVEAAEVDVRRNRSPACGRDLEFAVRVMDRLPAAERSKRWARNLRLRVLNALFRRDLHHEDPTRQRSLYDRLRATLDEGPPDPETLEIHLEADNRAAWLFIDSYEHAEGRRQLLRNLKMKRRFMPLLDLSLAFARTRGSLALLYVSMGRAERRFFEITLRHIRRALAALPETERGYNETVEAEVLAKLGRLEEAEARYRTLLARDDPPLPSPYPAFYARWGLGHLLLHRAPSDVGTGNPFAEEALRLAGEARVVIGETLPLQRALAFELAADARRALGEPRESRKDLEAAIQTLRFAHANHPGHPELAHAARFLAKRAVLEVESGGAIDARRTLAEAASLLENLPGDGLRRQFSAAINELRSIKVITADPAAVRTAIHTILRERFG